MKSQSHTSQLLKYIVDHLFPFSTGLSFLWIMIYSTAFSDKKTKQQQTVAFFQDTYETSYPNTHTVQGCTFTKCPQIHRLILQSKPSGPLLS